MTRNDWLMILTLSILWGGSFLFVEIGLEALSVLQVVWLRVSLAALTLAALLPVLGVAFPPLKVWPAVLGMSVLNNILPFTLIATAQGEITGSLASILNATTPLFTLVIAHLVTDDEKITKAKALGLILGFIGVVVMVAGSTTGGGVWAISCSLLAALSYGCAGVYGRRFKNMALPPLATAFGQVAGSSVLLLPALVLFAPLSEVDWPELRVGSAIFALAVFSTAWAYLLFFRILASAGATNLSIVTFLIPISATTMGALVLGERLLPQHIAGFLLICTGLIVIDGRWRKWRKN
ncbi:DMT family transporter [Thioclava sp. FR2]|uniref:DMT family transporter n=1 Tax=Thioclava sp. FR2 TaxID=3445780 RepID=UPI003EBCEA5F